MKYWLVGTVAAFSLIAIAHAQDATVKIGTEADYAPFEYKDATGQLKGFEIELGNALCARAKLQCEYVNMDFDGLIPALGAHKIDAALSQMSITPERAKSVLFTSPVTSVEGRFIAPKGSGLSDDPATLKGKTIGVQSGTTHETYANQKLKGIAEIKVYQGQDQAFADLQAGRIDATLCDETIGYDWLQKAGKDGYEFIGKPLTDKAIFGDGTGIALRKEDTALAAKLNDALASLIKDGTYQKLNAEYFPFSIAPK
ncbi:MAG TPA: lysine/arginine/ornithine ABC transporter substrate-binding protein [Acetobacteraceae bacterium]|nr:lysine/arginine/ornithine ABC transporter substrate-binding protein [Acetobacteraceae bacterium]